MYINNLRKTLNEMDEETYKNFEDYAYAYHKNELKRDGIKKAEIKKQINFFKIGKTSGTSHSNMDSFIYALDKIYGDNGAADVLYGIKRGKSWRELLIKVTSDIALPAEMKMEFLLENIRVLKSIIRNLLRFCADNNKDQTENNLRLVDEILKLAVEKKRAENSD